MSKMLLLFIHGLGGDAKKTWGRFPYLIENDDALQNEYEIGFYYYPTSLFRLPFSKKMPKIQTLASGLRTQINNQFSQYESIVLICHSLGGLIARQYLIEELKNKRQIRTSKLLLYAVPNNGAAVASIAKHISWKHNQLAQLCMHSDFIDFLNEEWFREKVGDRFNAKYVVAALDRVVDEKSAKGFWGNQNVDTIIDKGHINVVKPQNPSDLAFLILKNFVLMPTKEANTSQSEERTDSAFKRHHQYPRAALEGDIALTPYIPHGYALPRGFTGRKEELAMLSNWFRNTTEPVFVLEAIGGMGKSALSWVWLQQEVLEKNAGLDGVVWWSFYDEPFESFLKNLFSYLAPKNVTLERGGLTDQLSLLSSILFNNHILLILDGFERALRGYSGMRAMYIQEPPSTSAPSASSGDGDKDRRQREPIHPQAGQFLKRLATGKCKTLMTTRLFPAPLEEVAGVRHERLQGLSAGDSVRFFRSEGLTGTRAEMERAAAIYGNHPLMLKLLSTALRRKRAKDMADAFKLNLIDQKEPQKILATSFNLLSRDEQQVATTVAVFRSSFSFDAAQALFPEMSSRAESRDRLWEFLQGLQQLGFLFYDDAREQFDFHPILRSFLYDHLTTRDTVHQRAVVYFQALPAPEKVVTLADLAPVIERYHHLIGAGKFDEAEQLYYDRLHNPLYYQLANYNLIIELLRVLFPDGEDHPPRLQKEADQAWTLNELANSYALSGQPAQAVPLFLRNAKYDDEHQRKQHLAIGLGNVAPQQYLIGQLSASAGHLRKSIALCQEIKDEFWEAVQHSYLGPVWAYQGQWQKREFSSRAVVDETITVENELEKAFTFFEKTKNANVHFTHWLGLVSAYRAFAFLLQTRLVYAQLSSPKRFQEFIIQTLKEIKVAFEYAENQAKNNYPIPREFVRAYWLLGEALVQCLAVNVSLREQKLEIHFYDEPFQQITETLRLQKDNALHVAERCLSEGLRRCRSVNLVEMEPNLLLAWARLERQKAKGKQQKASGVGEDLKQVEEHVKEAREIAERAGYRLVLADIHLFCAEALLEQQKANGKKQEATDTNLFLGLSVEEHLKKAKEYALDASEYRHLYQSSDPHFYDGIPGAAMLKRGMTQQERIDNGYWVAYQIAEALEERVKSNLRTRKLD